MLPIPFGYFVNTTDELPPFYDNVILFLKFNGTNQSTSFVDNSKYNQTVTRNGTAVISTTQSSSSPSSLYTANTSDDGINSAPGTKDLVYISDTPEFIFGTATSFTIEMWAYRNNTDNTERALMGQATNGNNCWAISIGWYSNAVSPTTWGHRHSVKMISLVGGTYVCHTTATQSDVSGAGVNNWNHFAITRQSFATGSTWFVHINGVRTTNVFQEAGGSFNGNFPDVSGPICVGSGLRNLALSWQGYLDDVIVTKGVAKYTSSNFTPVKYNN